MDDHAKLPTYPDLDGMTAVVTGASRGLGAAAAQALARNGVTVALVGRDTHGLAHTTEQLRHAGGNALAVPADCTNPDELAAARELVHAEIGLPNALVAFAGGYGAPVSTASETAVHWRQVLDGDLTSVFLTVSAFLPDLALRQGAIVTMASESARRSTGSSAAYAAAKGGVISFTRHLAGEYADTGMRINCICPSTIETDKLRTRVPDDRRAAMAAQYPLRRLGQPADVAALTLFLLSTQSSWITGETFDLSGGRTSG